MAFFQKQERNLLVDFVRGVAILSIFLVHLPSALSYLGKLRYFAWSRWGFSSAFEVLIFVSGYTACLVYGKVLRREGAGPMVRRVYSRVAQIWCAHVVMFLFFVGAVGYVLHHYPDAFPTVPFHLGYFFQEPGRATIDFILLKYQPLLLDILPIYIVFLMGTPLLLVAIQRGCWGTLGGSIAIWLGAQLHPSWGGWPHHPFAWQLLFVGGMVLRHRQEEGKELPLRRGLAWGSGALLLLFALLRLFTHLEMLGEPLSRWVHLAKKQKASLGPLRLLHLVLFLYWGKYLIESWKPDYRRWWLAPIVQCGQHALVVYTIGQVAVLSINLRSTVMQWEFHPLWDPLMVGGALLLMLIYAARGSKAGVARSQ